MKLRHLLNMRFSLFILLFISSSLIYGQNEGRLSNFSNWEDNKHEIFAAVGATYFLGDLGGLNREGTQKSFVDLDFSSTRFGAGLGYRFRFHERFATSTQFYYGLYSGKDANTEEIIRRSRNLSFRSPIIELGQRIEFNIYGNDRGGARYNIRKFRGKRYRADAIYLFSGITGFYFNPQTKINGTWTDLRDLRTEGQGLPGGAEEYGKFNLAIPLGVGLKIGIGEFWRLGIEVVYNITFTDYIDDVSTNYYDPEILAKEVGKEAVYAANPAIENHTWFTEGQQRGNPNDNDAYLYTNFTITRNITYGKVKRKSRKRWKRNTRF